VDRARTSRRRAVPPRRGAARELDRLRPGRGIAVCTSPAGVNALSELALLRLSPISDGTAMRRSSTHPSPSKDSGRTGGASTAEGLNYQNRYAAFQILALIPRAQGAPHLQFSITAEPRVASGGQVTRWDICTQSPSGTVLTEVKLNPSTRDLLDFVVRIAESAASDPLPTYELVYSRAASPATLGTLEGLIRVAKEARSVSDFSNLLRVEQLPRSSELLAKLHLHGHEVLRRVSVRQVPDNHLVEDLEHIASSLSGQQARRLLDLVMARIATAAAGRLTIQVRELISEVNRANISLYVPVPPGNDASPDSGAILSLLRTCPTPLPLSVLRTTLKVTDDELQALLGPLTAADVVYLAGDLCAARTLTSAFPIYLAPDMPPKALTVLLTFIHSHCYDSLGYGQVRNAIALAQHCFQNAHYTLVATVFPILDKLLKRMGNKRLVLDIARMSIDASRRAHPRTRAEVEHEARALICGTAWVYQRVQRLDKARAAAQESRDLGIQIRFDINAAFATKCLGRLARLEAEAAASNSVRESKLHESKALLLEAIDRFSALPAFGPEHTEVGDCYSLLGRTLLQSEDLPGVADAIRNAYRLLTDPSSKDYRDLLLLNGDLVLRNGDAPAAIGFYSNALASVSSDDPEVSEIRARALEKRARAQASLARIAEAAQDYSVACEIYHSLGEYRAWATIRWEHHILRNPIAADVRALFKRVSDPRVRVAALDLHEARMSQLSKAIPRRTNVGSAYWAQLVNQATEQIAIEDIEW
jgi:hypothetical protein